MRNRYLVAYAVSEARRLRRTYNKMNGFGDPLQYSVFACDLSPKERIIMDEALTEIINLQEKRILIINPGPAEGRGATAIQSLGRQLQPARTEALIACGRQLWPNERKQGAASAPPENQ